MKFRIVRKSLVLFWSFGVRWLHSQATRDYAMRKLALIFILGALGGGAVAHGQTAPVITAQPTNRTVNGGSGASFLVTASGDPTPTYQWFFNEAVLPGRTNSALNVAAQTTNQGGYFA